MDGKRDYREEPPEAIKEMSFCKEMPLIVRWMKLEKFLELCDHDLKKSVNKMVVSMSENTGIDADQLDILINKSGSSITAIPLHLNPHLKKEIYAGSAEVRKWKQ